jgi:hypothetical protein
MMNFIKKVTGQGKKGSDCCGIEIKEVKDVAQTDSCCGTTVEANDSCCDSSDKNTESCCG